jgi:hypothetical protein
MYLLKLKEEKNVGFSSLEVFIDLVVFFADILFQNILFFFCDKIYS